MKKIFNNDWEELLRPEMEKDYYQNLRQFLIQEYKTKTIYPD
ncbi:MAG: uracil-DNA glycosylase, partial [Tissierellia bacterium]|nr:uracil-DNA glycosylase [Tissierellia bacterium]